MNERLQPPVSPDRSPTIRECHCVVGNGHVGDALAVSAVACNVEVQNASERTLDDVAVVVADRRARVEYRSRGAEKLFGHSAVETVGTPVARLVPHHLRERHGAGWRAAWRSGGFERGASIMIPVLCADGTIRGFASYISPILDPHGTMVAVMAIWSPHSSQDVELSGLADS